MIKNRVNMYKMSKIDKIEIKLNNVKYKKQIY